MFTFHARLKGTLLLMVGAALVAVSCGPKKTAQSPDANLFAGFVKAYTGGIVTEDATLRIDLMADATAMPTDGLFALKPSVSGVTQWDSPSTVRFIPDMVFAAANTVIRSTARSRTSSAVWIRVCSSCFF